MLLISATFLGGFVAFGNDAGIATGSSFGVAYGEGSENLDHFMDYIHDLGLARTKVSFFWHELEPQPGVYDFTVLDQYLSQLGPDDQGLLNIFTDGWCTQEQGRCKGSPLVDCPYNAAGCETSCADRYRAFILAVAEHVKEVGNGGIKYWQRDTEPASSFPHYPADAPEAYVELQRIFYETVKSVFPDAIVIGCNQNGSFTRAGEPVNAAFFDYFLKNARDWFDVLDVRLYEDVYTILARVEWFRNRMHYYGYDKPIVSTEQGGPDPRTVHDGNQSLFSALLAEVKTACYQSGPRSRATCFNQYVRTHREAINPKLWPFYFPDDPEQGAIYVKMHTADIVTRNVVMLSSGVEATWWWNLQSRGTDPIFGRMRLMTPDYRFLPGYAVYKRMVQTLGAVTAVTRIDTSDSSVYLYRIDRSGADTPVYVAWRRVAGADPYDTVITPAVSVVLPLPSGVVRVTDALGNAIDAGATGNGVSVKLGGIPVYIEGTD